jgi:hypothetical protein
MKPESAPLIVRSWRGLLLAIAVLTGVHSGLAQTALYSTSFESAEGYTGELSLIGQNGWVGYGSGGNGIVTNFIPGWGQQAYIGFFPPDETNDFFSVYRPINFAPVPASRPLIKFSVVMQIVDSSSTNRSWDDFRWSVYNTNGMRLFSLDFDNSSLLVSYLLDDDAGFVSTETKFDNQGSYDLVIAMNFGRNLWSATLNDQVIVNAKPITTTGAPLNLGDVDAVWSLRDPASPGDNYMLFDDYRITAESSASIPPRLEARGMRSGGSSKARIYGEPGLTYRVEVSADLKHWEPLMTFTAPPGGVLEFQDPGAVSSPQRFYRARQGR